MIISVEEALKQGVENIAGAQPRPDFVFSSRIDSGSKKNIWFSSVLEDLINKNLSIQNYSEKYIQSLSFIFVVFPDADNGVDWKERKSYTRARKILKLEIKLPDYQRFCDATKQEAMKIMAEQTLRGTEKFLSKVKDFDYHKFYADLKELFEKEGIL